jgi:hypothetical protein
MTPRNFVVKASKLTTTHRQNQLGADQPESDGNGQSGRTGYNDSNYDGRRQAGNFDASGTSTPAYRQEDGEWACAGRPALRR